MGRSLGASAGGWGRVIAMLPTVRASTISPKPRSCLAPVRVALEVQLGRSTNATGAPAMSRTDTAVHDGGADYGRQLQQAGLHGPHRDSYNVLAPPGASTVV